ncbi:hypothetical protein ACFCZ1_00015 [Streptomyces sp. NPDC056224]|uniref:hypothetical protein n=1 Tax=Streptomyces sp. NPDC056224 TaxID=3345750 RepID=UPI0035D6D934
MTDELRGLLRESAGAHLPDRARMLARVERGTARPGTARRPRDRERTRALSWPKIVLATLATTGTLTLSALMVVAAVHDPEPPRNPTAAAPSAAAPSADAPSAAAPSADGPSAAAPSADGPSADGRAVSPTAAGSRTEDGPLWADGSVDPHSNAYWAQSNVTLKARKPLTALVVELRIALTEGVKATGSWRTRPAADFDLSARQEGGFLVYRWTLKPGRAVPPGEHVFAGQYDHADGGRDAKDDTYRIDATAGAAESGAAVWGGFA